MTVPFDPLRALRVLHEHDVRYVLIGGFASTILGASLVTRDLDICYERTPENMERLAAALRSLHATLRVARVDDSDRLPLLLDGKTLAAGDSFTFRTDAGDVDVLATPSGTGGYRDLAAKAVVYDLGEGLDAVPIVALEDLMRMKRASGRAKDVAHLELLAALQEVLAEGEDAPPPG